MIRTIFGAGLLAVLTAALAGTGAVVESTERTGALLERLLVLAAVEQQPALQRAESVDLAEVTRRALRHAAGPFAASLDPVRVRGDDLAFPSLFFVGAVLFVITLLLNVIGDAFVRRTRQRY